MPMKSKDLKNLLSTFCCNISNRGRLRLTGQDRVRFLNGQVTNDIKSLATGKGCYAALTNAKGKMRGDAVILNTSDGLLLDVEPGNDARIASELEKFIIADDVQIENITSTWHAYTLVGDQVAEVLKISGLCTLPPKDLFEISSFTNNNFGKVFLFRSHRAQNDSFDLWVEQTYSVSLAQTLIKAVEQIGGSMLDASILEIPRVEAGILRFGVEMDENTLPPEAGIETIAISYTKGCYVGQEVISRIKSVGHVNRMLVRLRLPESAERGMLLQFAGKEIGKLGSAISSPRFGRIGLAIIRHEAAKLGTHLTLPKGEAVVVEDFKL